jgi:hypothetical protein
LYLLCFFIIFPKWSFGTYRFLAHLSWRVKILWKYLKIFFSRTRWPNSMKLGTIYLWVKGIQVCSNKGEVIKKM